MKWLLLIVVMAGCNVAPSSPQKNGSQSALLAAKDCEDPDGNIECCFANMPGNLSAVVQVKKRDAGELLTINGRLFHADGATPFARVIMYAYHTDSTGRYTKRGDETGIQKFHGHLHGWAKTDDSGRYTIKTIRPASYPNSTIPAHIHAAIKEPSGKTYYISDFVFEGDPFVTRQYLQSLEKWKHPGSTGIVTLRKENGEWWGTRDIVLPN
ncbi:MAG: intradiol ring-cleavage dioxygenase [Bacteroidota bacterium]